MFYVIELTTYVDSTPDAKAIYGAYTKDDAIATYHSKMGGAMKNANYQSEMIYVVSATGNTIIAEYWNRENEEA